MSLNWGRGKERESGFWGSCSRTLIGRVQSCVLVGPVDIDERKVITFGVQERFPASLSSLLSTLRHVQEATGSFKMQEVTVSNAEDTSSWPSVPKAGPLSMNPLLSRFSESICSQYSYLFGSQLRVSCLDSFSLLCTLLCQQQLSPCSYSGGPASQTQD